MLLVLVFFLAVGFVSAACDDDDADGFCDISYCNFPISDSVDFELVTDLSCPSQDGISVSSNVNDIILDCNGFSITGDGTNEGITIDGATGITIKNCFIDNFLVGIYLDEYSSQNVLLDNVVSNSERGIWLYSSSDNVLNRNVAHDSTEYDVVLSSSSAVLNNNVAYSTGEAGLNNFFCSGSTVSGSGNFFEIASGCNSWPVEDQDYFTITDPQSITCGDTIEQGFNGNENYGYYVVDSSCSAIENGITLESNNVFLNCQDNTLTGSGSYSGVVTSILTAVDNVVIQRCDITNFNYGISSSDDEVQMSYNNIYENSRGVYITSDENILSNNIIQDNLQDGVYIYGTSLDNIINDNFICNNNLNEGSYYDFYCPYTSTVSEGTGNTIGSITMCNGWPQLGDDYESCEASCTDGDNDGYGDINANNGLINNCDYDEADCDDSDINVNPGRTESCGNSKDDNCNGIVDCDDDQCIGEAHCVDADADGYNAYFDCDDNDPAVNPGATEICDDGINNDCDFYDVDCDDPDCIGDVACPGTCQTVNCGDTISNPGSYCLSECLTLGSYNGVDFGVMIESDDVYFDCNSVPIVGQGSGNGVLVGKMLPDESYMGITISGCDVSNFERGIFLKAVTSLVESSFLHDNVQQGIWVTGSSNTIQNNEIYDNTYKGIYVDGEYNQFQENLIYGNSQYGISISADNNELTDNNFCTNDIDISCSPNHEPTTIGNYFETYSICSDNFVNRAIDTEDYFCDGSQDVTEDNKNTFIADLTDNFGGAPTGTWTDLDGNGILEWEDVLLFIELYLAANP